MAQGSTTSLVEPRRVERVGGGCVGGGVGGVASLERERPPLRERREGVAARSGSSVMLRLSPD